MKPGDKVVCVDDQGWLIPKPGYEHLAPKKGLVYVIRSYEKFGCVGAVSLIGGNPDDFYRACRFVPLADKKDELRLADVSRGDLTAGETANVL